MSEAEYLELIEQQAEQLRRCAQALTLAGHLLLSNFNQAEYANELYDIAHESLAIVGEDVVMNEYHLIKNAAGAACASGPAGELAGNNSAG